MSSIYKRENSKIYYISFCTQTNGKRREKKFSLSTKSRKVALKKQLEYDELYEAGKIDPYNGWTPSEHEKSNKRGSSKSGPSYLEESIKLFINKRSHLREKTLTNYEYILGDFQNQMTKSTPICWITEEDVRDFCFKEHLSPASQRNYLTHLKTFFNWLYSEGFIETNIVENIRKPRIDGNIRDKVISRSDLDAIIKQCKNDITRKVRLRMIVNEADKRAWFKPVVYCAYFAGLRRDEIVCLKWKNVDLKEGILYVTGETKTGDERAVPMRKELLQELKEWKSKTEGGSELVFFSMKKAHYGKKLSGDNISKVYKKYVKATGVKSTTCFHGLRHSCGTDLKRLRFDISDVAKVLGHSDLRTTLIYEHTSAEDIRDRFREIEDVPGNNEQLAKENEQLRKQIAEMKKILTR